MNDDDRAPALFPPVFHYPSTDPSFFLLLLFLMHYIL